VAEQSAQLQSRREAVQPSLWDRLVDDLPGLIAEYDQRRADLAALIGPAGLVLAEAGGVRALEADRGALPDDIGPKVVAFLQLRDRRAWLEERGIVVTQDVLREAVRRDIEALFNTERLEARFLLTDTERRGAEDPADLIDEFPHVRRSVLNYGVPPFSGRRAHDFDPDALARELRDVVAQFEPRLKRDTIRIRIDTGDKSGLKILIEGLLLLSPVPERLRLSTTVDLDNGRAATRIEDV
jgi:type VI secretion system protein ImpF